MPDDDLIRMVNQIARFFEPYPEDEAITGIADHLRRFWDPSMRAALIATNSQALHRLAALAVQRLGDTPK